MSKHTPGPWTVDVGESSAPGMGSDVVRVDVRKGDQRIAGVTVRPGSRALSNARLIAAAPDLLEALERIVGLGAGDPARFQDEIEDADRQAREAIAKARGTA